MVAPVLDTSETQPAGSTSRQRTVSPVLDWSVRLTASTTCSTVSLASSTPAFAESIAAPARICDRLTHV
jgi:hypothetical protein